MEQFIPVILAGGSGTRLWPLSRQNRPKQFLCLNGNLSLLQQTFMRLQGLKANPWLLICNEDHRFIAAEQVRQLDIKHGGIFLEPVSRNTAPAIALAAIYALESKHSARVLQIKQHKDSNIEKDPLLLVLAADHVIENVDAFQVAVKQATVMAQQGKLVTFGIVANSPETGYGYIKRGAEIITDCKPQEANGKDQIHAFTVDSFVEKPNLAKATEYIESGDYYWNSGMFMFKASRYLEVLKQFNPQIVTACTKAMKTQHEDMDFLRINEKAFIKCPSDSIDYAVMEPLSKTSNSEVVVIPLDAGWNDIGGFNALWDISDKDNNNNSLVGDVKTIDTKNSLVISDDKLIATVGVDNLVIINTKDTLLVAHKDKAQEVKNIVNQLKGANRPEVKFHREVFRPWGKYDSVDNGESFQVKRITVKPGAKLSVQMHHHRAEHWIVVSGMAKVTNGDKTIFLSENESTYRSSSCVRKSW
jgi:mannose-1-phosphate guanylyltransferase/mannose-6-phosphate isomerase